MLGDMSLEKDWYALSLMAAGMDFETQTMIDKAVALHAHSCFGIDLYLTCKKVRRYQNLRSAVEMCVSLSRDVDSLVDSLESPWMVESHSGSSNRIAQAS